MASQLTSYVDGAKALHIGSTPRIAVEHMGDGPLVFFLHGIGGDRSTWAHQLTAFAGTDLGAGYCAAAWDARGYGNSDDYDGALSFTDIADDLARVLDTFAVDTAHIVGTSMGGRISLEFYANHPDRFATLTLAGVHASFGNFSPEKQKAFVAARSKPLLEDGLEPADIAPGAIGRLGGPNISDDARMRAIAAASRLHKHSYIKTVEATTQFDREHVLAEITVPTLVIGGEFDPLTPPDMTRKVAADIDGADYHMIYDVGHLGNLENPVEFNRLVDQFLARYRDRANIAADPQILAG
jgi:3-oxoadipate enol-lactonase